MSNIADYHNDEQGGLEVWATAQPWSPCGWITAQGEYRIDLEVIINDEQRNIRLEGQAHSEQGAKTILEAIIADAFGVDARISIW